MIRALIVVALVFLVAAGFAWLAERPGGLLITWQGYEIRTSLMVAAIGIALVIAAIAAVGRSSALSCRRRSRSAISSARGGATADIGR